VPGDPSGGKYGGGYSAAVAALAASEAARDTFTIVLLRSMTTVAFVGSPPSYTGGRSQLKRKGFA